MLGCIVFRRAGLVGAGLPSSHRGLLRQSTWHIKSFVAHRPPWLKRLTGEGEHPNQLDAIIYENRADLTRARIAEDNRLIAVVDRYDDAALASLRSYKTTSGMPHSQVLSDILMHLFNHQTHHRGQAHGCLSILTGSAPPVLDLLAFQQGGAAPDLEALLDKQ
jgi:uncharacterized damage-inducible protein DinB